MQDRYTPQRVAMVLRGDTDDADEVIDVSQAVLRLPLDLRTLLTNYGAGMSPAQAGEGVTKSPKRQYVRALRMVTELLNGDMSQQIASMEMRESSDDI